MAAETAIVEAKKSARAARLRYVGESVPGIRRVRKGKGFAYITPSGRTVRSAKVLDRIAALAIPPAWEKVWICAWPNGHLQATGYDARRRKQYIYHPHWEETRDRQKYDKMLDFARALPKIRGRVKRDLARRGLPRRKVLAAVVRLLELSLIRVGNDEYAAENGSFGLTTIRNRHARVKGSRIRFDFRGKHQIEHEIEVCDSQLARVVRQCQDPPGQELFEYSDDRDEVHDVGSADVNAYLQEIAGQQFSAKDFRTWAGTVTAAWELHACEPCTSKAAAKRNINQAISRVAELLGNTRAICRRCYIHPAVIDSYLETKLAAALEKKGRASRSLSAKEAAIVRLLAPRRRGSRKPRKAA